MVELQPVIRRLGSATAVVCLVCCSWWAGRVRSSGRSAFVVRVQPSVVSGKSLYMTEGVEVEFPDGLRLQANDVLAAYEALYFGAAQTCMQHVLPHWKGMPIQQHPGDIFKVVSFLWNERPDVMIELGTDTGGSAAFYAEVMTSYNSLAHVITIDVANHISKSHTGFAPSTLASSSRYWGSTVQHLIGDPLSLLAGVDSLLRDYNTTRVFLVEDSDHSYESVMANLQAYHRLVGPCGWVLVHDTLKEEGAAMAVQDFLAKHPEFSVDRRYEFCPGGPFTEHPQSWLRRTQGDRPCGA